MNVLFICHSLTGGGAERVCVDVANGLCKRGHNVMILTDTSSTVTYEPLADVRLLSLVKPCGRIKTKIKCFRLLCSVLKREKPDVVISILYLYSALAKLASMKTIGCPVIASDHNSFERPAYAKMSFRSIIEKFFFNYFLDGLTVLTEADYKFLKNRFRHTYVMPNPLGIIPANEVPQKEKVVLAVGRLDDWHCKGFDLLINVWKRLWLNHLDWKLNIVGSGSTDSVNHLKDLASDCENIEFLPYTKDILNLYQKASIFVLSSRYEGFGLVLTEAMSQGCACIACNYKGRQAEIISDGIDGLLCEVDNCSMLEQKLHLLICDLSLRELLQKNAIGNVKRFYVEHIAEKWEKMLLEYYSAN